MRWLLYRPFALIIFGSTLLVAGSYAQGSLNKSKSQTSVKLSSEKPGVYISFERLGKRMRLRDDEGDDGVWLRLVNNMRFSIRFCSFGISEEGDRLIASQKNFGVGVKYDVELTNPQIFDEAKNKMPIGYGSRSSCFLFELKPGSFISFSVPNEHLVKGLSIRVPFNYEWEKLTEDNPRHFVLFGSSSLPNIRL